MEKNWYQKLMAVCANYYTAVDKGKGADKLESLMSEWEMVSRSALIVAASLEFKEILGWKGCIAPKLQDVYANVLKTSTTNTEDRLLAIILTGQIEEVVDISGKTEVSLLSKTTEKVAKEIVVNEPLRLNILAVINNRPDILSLFESETFRKFKLYDNNMSFLKNEKLDLLLACFQTSKDYKNFSERIKTGERLSWCFNNNEKIISSWDHVSDVEFQDFPTPEKGLSIYNNSSKKWKEDVNNFKAVLKLIVDSNYFNTLLSLIKSGFNENSFYYTATIIAKELSVSSKLISGDNNFKELYAAAPGTILTITDTRRRIIEKYLTS